MTPAEKRVRDLIADGYIRGIKIGHAYKVPKVNVINYVLEEQA